MTKFKLKLFLVGGVSVLIVAAIILSSSSDLMGAFGRFKGGDFSFPAKACNDNIDNDSDGYIDLNGCDCSGNGRIDEGRGSQTALRVALCEAEPGTDVAGYTAWCEGKSAGTWYDADSDCDYRLDDSEGSDEAAHCSDGIYNEGEEGLDCGWTCSNECVFTEKDGELLVDETWSGNVYVENVEVLEGATLTIEPGTIVKFMYDRDYKTMERGALRISGGDIRAIGTAAEMIWFTSAAPDPINGDWQAIILEDSLESIFDHVVVEYGEMGIEQFGSVASVTNSIIRWINAEGLYAERSEPYFEGNLLYGNGYHEIALEQHNEGVVVRNNIFHDGVGAVHNQKTTNLIEGNYFYNYEWSVITGGIDAVIEIIGNKFEDISSDPPDWVYDSVESAEGITVQLAGGAIAFIQGNDFGDGSVSVPVPILDFEDITNFEIDYIPGDPEDEFAYIYDDEDETRKVLNTIGEGLGFGWTLEYADGYLYRFIGSGGESGEYMDFIKIDPDTGEYENYGYYEEIINPRGLVWDGEFFYTNDASNLKIFKFAVGNDGLTIYDSFDVPYADLQVGTNGLTADSEFLYLRSSEGTIYKLSKTGELIGEIDLPGVSLVWTGEYFWAVGGCNKGICKYTSDGELVGEIYPPAKDAWAITWDGENLWTLQRTCERWDDPKIYQLEILDDSLDDCYFDSQFECVSYEIEEDHFTFEIENIGDDFVVDTINQYFMGNASDVTDCSPLENLDLEIASGESVEITYPCEVIDAYSDGNINLWVQIVGEGQTIDGRITNDSL
jgi:hypothetical protein